MTPIGWETTMLKYVADCNRRVLSEATAGNREFKYVDIGAVGQGNISIPETLTKFADAPSRARRVAEQGDTIVSTVRTYLRAVATVPETDDDLVFSTGFAVLHPRPHVSRRFLAYALQGDTFVDKVVANSVGVSYPAITASDLMALDLVLPCLEEQRCIADYLDHETTQIDALVAKQEELVGALKERRSSIVDLLLTSGSSKKTRLKNLLIRNDGGVWGDDVEGDGGTVVLRSTEQTVDGRWNITDPAVRGLSVSEFNAARLEVGDLVVTKTSGSSKHIGKATLVDQEIASLPACHGNFMQRLRVRSIHSSKFLWYCLNSRIIRAVRAIVYYFHWIGQFERCINWVGSSSFAPGCPAGCDR